MPIGIKITNEEFLRRANLKHNFRYSYPEEFKKLRTYMDIICPVHGIFTQRPEAHLKYGCAKCFKPQIPTTSEFIEKCIQIHGNKYDYSLTEYNGSVNKIKIICNIHGEFEQNSRNHLKYGCMECGGKRKLTTEEFIEKANKKHKNKYEYPDPYIHSKKKIRIICKKHGEFFQEPCSHLQGQGCLFCFNCLSKGEQTIKKYLDNLGFIINDTYFREYKFKDCKNILPLKYDFYLPLQNIAIEYDGPHHFIQAEKGRFKNVSLKDNQKRDQIKNKYCEDNNIKLIRISYLESKYITNILNKELNICV